MSGIFTAPKLTPPTMPVAPSITDDSVQRAADESALRARSGRASTILTKPSQQREAGASRQQYLGGA